MSERLCVGRWWPSGGLLASLPCASPTRCKPHAAGAHCVHIMQACPCTLHPAFIPQSALLVEEVALLAAASALRQRGVCYRRQAAASCAVQESRLNSVDAHRSQHEDALPLHPGVGMQREGDTLLRDASSVACMEAYQVCLSASRYCLMFS